MIARVTGLFVFRRGGAAVLEEALGEGRERKMTCGFVTHTKNT